MWRLALLLRSRGEMEVTLAEAMPGPSLPPCNNAEIPVVEVWDLYGL